MASGYCFFHSRELPVFVAMFLLQSPKLLLQYLLLVRLIIATIFFTVTRYPRFLYSVKLMTSLHWLPVQFRIISQAPKPRVLRSSGFHWFPVPMVKTHIGIRAFSVHVPILWNSLPEHVTLSNTLVSFRHHLKPHLYRFAYPSYVF